MFSYVLLPGSKVGKYIYVYLQIDIVVHTWVKKTT